MLFFRFPAGREEFYNRKKCLYINITLYKNLSAVYCKWYGFETEKTEETEPEYG